jgi:HK97 family phage prohead protease
MPLKAFAFEVKALSEQGQFSGIASTYGNVDQQGDVIQAGAFTRTLSDAGKQRPLLWQHSTPIGLVTLTDTASGLLAEGQLSLGIQQAKDAYVLLKDRVVRGMSVGFSTIKEQAVGGVRQLLELKLYEVSLVTFPANEMAGITSVKSATRQGTIEAFADALRELKEFRRTNS